MVAKRPVVSQVYLHHAEETTVHVTGPFPKTGLLRDILTRYFDSEGALVGSPTRMLPALIQDLEQLTPRQRSRLQITPEVERYVARLEEIESIERQKEWYLEQVEHGNRSQKLLSTTLYPYQESGAMHLGFGRRALLADDMGLGKTVQGIAATSLLHQLRDIQRVLVVCPASLKHQWAREIQRFTSFTTQVIGGNLIDCATQHRQRNQYRQRNQSGGEGHNRGTNARYIGDQARCLCRCVWDRRRPCRDHL